MRAIDELLKRFPPPARPVELGVEDEWPRMQRRMGSVLPRDYKDFVNAYGSVTIRGFLRPFNPFSQDEYGDLATQMALQLSALRYLKERDPTQCPYPLYFEVDGILPWGITDNGDVLFWETRGHPDQWPVIVNESRSADYERFEMSMVELVLSFLSGSTTVSAFPDDLTAAPSIAAMQPRRHPR
jgi:hypothetical protein